MKRSVSCRGKWILAKASRTSTRSSILKSFKGVRYRSISKHSNVERTWPNNAKPPFGSLVFLDFFGSYQRFWGTAAGSRWITHILYRGCAAYRRQTWQHPSLSSPRASRAMNIKVPVSYGTIVDEASTETVMELHKAKFKNFQQLSSR